jgi:hypothetical protein
VLTTKGLCIVLLATGMLCIATAPVLALTGDINDAVQSGCVGQLTRWKLGDDCLLGISDPCIHEGTSDSNSPP